MLDWENYIIVYNSIEGTGYINWMEEQAVTIKCLLTHRHNNFQIIPKPTDFELYKYSVIEKGNYIINSVKIK